MKAIVSTLPPPPQPPQAQGGQAGGQGAVNVPPPPIYCNKIIYLIQYLFSLIY